MILQAWLTLPSCLASSFDTRVCPQAGWPPDHSPGVAMAATAASISGSTRFFRIGLRRDIS